MQTAPTKGRPGMSDPVTELSLRWKRAPDTTNTIALANAVRGPLHASLIQEIGAFATDRLGSDVPVLLAVARMYMSAQRLSDAQSILVTAGKLAPRDAFVYRILGEVLLRRGDAERAEKVFERAMQLGATDGGTRLWLDRARLFKDIQAKLGARAVATEVEHAAPAATSDLSPDLDPVSDRTIPLPEDSEAPTSIQRSPLVSPRKPPPPQLQPPPPVRQGMGVGGPNAGTGANALLASLAPAAGMTPTGMPKAQPAFLFDKEAATTASARNLEESVTFDLGSAPKSRQALPSLAEMPLDPVPSDAAQPKPRELLDALSLAGVYEPNARQGAHYQWAKPQRDTKRRGSWLLVVVMVLFLGGSFGTYRYVQMQREIKRATAAAIMNEIDTALLEGRVTRLNDLEAAFGRAFELDSRSKQAALSWARERALVGLIRGGQDVAFEDATSRARAVGVPEADLAFTQIASFLFQNDSAGAVALLPRHDAAAANDPWYQLLAGVCLERLGDPRAFERYAAAVKLSPDFVAAQVALIRYEIVEGDRARAIDLAAQFKSKRTDRPEAQALLALLWANDPSKPKAPVEAVEIVTKHEGLPLSLAWVPDVVSARLALEKNTMPEAREAIRHGLGLADGPGTASAFGFLALDADDEALARKAALVAVGYSAVYPRARVLAARVALLGGRLDEALKATEELDPTQVDVALSRAIVAYERADADGLARALEALPGDKRTSSAVSPAVLAQGALAGHADIAPSKLLSRSTSDDLWSDVIAMDIALDTGNLEVASAIGNRWLGLTAKDKVPSLRALRLSRLARYTNKLDDADLMSQLALAGATTTIRSIAERAFVLAAREKPTEIGSLIAKNQSAVGPMGSWLGAYATASAGKVDDARGRSATLDPPSNSAPAPVRVVSLVALGAMKDKKRGLPVLESLASQGQASPDVTQAAQALGAAPALTRRR